VATLASRGAAATRWAVLSALDATLAVADATLASALAREALTRILTSPLVDDVLRRLAVQALDSPELDRLVSEALDSPEAERLAGRVIDSRLIDVVVERLLESDGLWLLVDEIARSPSVTEAISQQGAGFVNQIAGVARDRSRNADDRLERLAARLASRLPGVRAHPGGEPASGP
jgi:hypothetical protein